MRSTDRDVEFTAYVTDHRHRLLRTARLLSAGDDAGAEDLVQATLTRLYVAWPRVRRADDPVGYGVRSLTHAFVDERRRAHRRRESPTDQVARHAGDLAGADGDPDLRRSVLAALADLPPRQRAVVVLRHWLDLDVATTARYLGCSAGTVKSQTSKGLDHLRATLGHHLVTEGTPS